jgi:hypothetical protein
MNNIKMGERRRRVSADFYERSDSLENEAVNMVIGGHPLTAARKILVKQARRALARLFRWLARMIEPRQTRREIGSPIAALPAPSDAANKIINRVLLVADV